MGTANERGRIVAGCHYGIDVGGTKTELAVFDANLNRIDERRVATITNDYDEFLKTLAKLVNDADQVHSVKASIGVGVNGIVDQTGRSFSVNLPCINGREVESDLGALLSRPVSCLNDVHAFALSEANGGAGEGYDSVIGMILGTGSSSGFCDKGKLKIGVNGVAGEWGHLPISAPIVDRYQLPIFTCSCGQTGCIERYITGPGLSDLASHMIGSNVSSHQCIDRMRKRDPAATAVFSIWVELVATVIAQIVLHTNPDVIVIGGGMSTVDELFEQLRKAVSALMLKGLEPPPILRAKFGDSSGVRGAAIVGAQP